MNITSKNFMSDRPYQKYEDYMEDLFVHCFLKVYKYMLHEETNQFAEAIVQAETWLALRGVDSDQELDDWETNLKERKELTTILGSHYPIDQMKNKLGLDDFQLFVVFIALLISLDRQVDKICKGVFSHLLSDALTLDVCATLYFKDNPCSLYTSEQIIINAARELKLLFPEMDNEQQLRHGVIHTDIRLNELIFGFENHRNNGIRLLESDTVLEPMFNRDNTLNDIENIVKFDDYPMMLLVGDHGAGKKHLVSHFVKQHNETLVFYDIHNIDKHGESFIEAIHDGLKYAVRECVVKTIPLAIIGVDLLSEKELNMFIDLINAQYKQMIQLIFLLMSQETYATSRTDVLVIELEKFNELQRIELWQHFSKGYDFEPEVSFETVGNTFDITPGQMVDAISSVHLYAKSLNLPMNQNLLHKACYAQINHELSNKINLVTTVFKWDELKMPKEDKEILSDLCQCVRNKHTVMNTWGFSKIIPYGAGVTVLFSGAPGTGKTMAAQVIANELNMELYKIDLSQLIDKYVGETEKNIKQIFEQAQKSNSILFFDEADAIFNKRIEANSSNDRFANIESSLLLQCIEEYSGISILATNNMNAIDSAFIRRFKYYILFREPDEQVRYDIWSSVFPEQAPLAVDVDLRLLAHQFAFTGAIIKNVALSAAYLAAAKNSPISMVDILKSIKREMFKNNLILTKDSLGGFGYLYDELMLSRKDDNL